MSYEVVHNADAERYEIHVDGQLAGFTEAHPRADGVLVFPHTEVKPEFEGQGLASKLVRGAFDDLRARGLTAVPLCPYVQAWLQKHPEYQDRVA